MALAMSHNNPTRYCNAKWEYDDNCFNSAEKLPARCLQAYEFPFPYQFLQRPLLFPDKKVHNNKNLSSRCHLGFAKTQN